MWLSDDDFRAAALAPAADGAGADVTAALAAFPPGRSAGLERLAGFSVAGYAGGRNFAGGRRSVSTLSPYLRHGLVTLVEARDHALRAGRARAGKFVQELAWREYWRHVLDRRGRSVYADIEVPKHAHARAPGLPEALVSGATGLACVDEPLAELVETGYMHNHARMWFASATTHLFQRHHAPGAALFAEHLLDHDPASNSLSWQWVDSSFAHRPYLYDRRNVERWAPGMCERCPAGRAGECPFDASYDELARRELGAGRPDPPPAAGAGAAYGPPAIEERPSLAAGAGAPVIEERPSLAARAGAPATEERPPVVARAREEASGAPVVWLHTSSLGAVDPALAAAPAGAMIAIVLDLPNARTVRHSAKRLAFVSESALETAASLRAEGREVRLAVADPAEALLDLDPGAIWVTDEPDPWIRDSVARLRRAGATVELAPRVLLAPGAAEVPDKMLGRFSRWWKRAEREAFTPAQLSLDL